MMVEAGAVPPLIGLIASRSTELQKAAMGAVEAFSRTTAGRAALVGDVARLVALLGDADVRGVVATALGALCKEHSDAVVQAGGISSLVVLCVNNSAAQPDRHQAAEALNKAGVTAAANVAAALVAALPQGDLAVHALVRFSQASSINTNALVTAGALSHLALATSGERITQDALSAACRAAFRLIAPVDQQIDALIMTLDGDHHVVRSHSWVADDLAEHARKHPAIALRAGAAEVLVQIHFHRSIVNSKVSETLRELAEQRADVLEMICAAMQSEGAGQRRIAEVLAKLAWNAPQHAAWRADAIVARTLTPLAKMVDAGGDNAAAVATLRSLGREAVANAVPGAEGLRDMALRAYLTARQTLPRDKARATAEHGAMAKQQQIESFRANIACPNQSKVNRHTIHRAAPPLFTACSICFADFSTDAAYSCSACEWCVCLGCGGDALVV